MMSQPIASGASSWHRLLESRQRSPRNHGLNSSPNSTSSSPDQNGFHFPESSVRWRRELIDFGTPCKPRCISLPMVLTSIHIRAMGDQDRTVELSRSKSRPQNPFNRAFNACFIFRKFCSLIAHHSHHPTAGLAVLSQHDGLPAATMRQN